MAFVLETHPLCEEAAEEESHACACRLSGGTGTQAGSVFPAAFEDMLENPLNSTQWMNDPETGPVMLQISRIFQTLNRT